MTTIPPFDCTDIKAMLSGLIDDELDATTRYGAERHLAQCAACRAVVNEAEAQNQLMTMYVAELAPRRLPEGFVESVLSRTAYARMYEHAGFSWINWTGWVAAAACVCLATTLWIIDRQSRSRDNRLIDSSSMIAAAPDGAAPMTSTPSRVLADGSGLRSFTYEGPVQATALRAASRMIIESEAMLDEPTRTAIDEQLALAHPAPSVIDRPAARTLLVLSQSDRDTLDAASRLLEMIAESDVSGFSDIDLARRVAVYDDLAARLADVRTRLRASDRAAVLAAESIILRVVNGPLDMSDLRMLHDTAGSLNLADQLAAISEGRSFETAM